MQFNHFVRLCFALVIAFHLSACGGGWEASSAQRVESRLAADPTPFTGHGWYFDPGAGGTGLMFEGQGSSGFLGVFLYDESGNPVWHVATGNLATLAAGGHLFTGELRNYTGGSPFGRTPFQTPASTTVGTVTIKFSGSGINTTGLVQLPGGRAWQVQRFNFGGIQVGPTSTQSETGWYWNASFPGVGYAIEVQNNQIFLAMFHYASTGAPRWHVFQGSIAKGTLSFLNLSRFEGGQTLTGQYRAPTGPVAESQGFIDVTDPCIGRFSVFSRLNTNFWRFSFGGLPSGQECRARANSNSSKMPGRYTGVFNGTEAGSLDIALSQFGELSGTTHVTKEGRSFIALGSMSPTGAFYQRSLTLTGEFFYNGQFNPADCSIAGSWQRSKFAGSSEMTGGGSFTLRKTGSC